MTTWRGSSTSRDRTNSVARPRHRVDARVLGPDRAVAARVRVRGGRRARASVTRRSIDEPVTVARLAAALDDPSLGPVVVIGHSLGGMIAQELALLAGERVRGLVLCNTIPGVTEGAREFNPVLADLAESSGSEAVAEALLPAMLGPQAAREHRPRPRAVPRRHAVGRSGVAGRRVPGRRHVRRARAPARARPFAPWSSPDSTRATTTTSRSSPTSSTRTACSCPARATSHRSSRRPRSPREVVPFLSRC